MQAFVPVLVLAFAASAFAQLGNVGVANMNQLTSPLTTAYTRSGVSLNATAWPNGNLYYFTISSADRTALYHHIAGVTLSPTDSSRNVLIRAVYKNAQGNYVGYTGYDMQSNGMSSGGYLALNLDAKKIYDQSGSGALEVGFWVTPMTTTGNTAFDTVTYSITVRREQPARADDANGEIGNGSGGKTLTFTVPGGGARQQIVAKMNARDHNKLECIVTAPAVNKLYSATMRNAAFFSFDDVSNFGSTETSVVVSTCLSNSSCAILDAYYFVDVVSNMQTDSNGVIATAQYNYKAGAAAVVPSAFVLLAAAAAAVLAKL